MSAAQQLAGATPGLATDWHSIDWKAVYRNVRRLQARIVKAVRAGRWGKEDKWSSGPGFITTKFVSVGQEVYLDLDNYNAVLMRYIQGDMADEMLVRIDGGNNVAWFLTDWLGSVRDIVDGGGTVIDSITYDASGKITAETNTANRGRYAYVGMQFDADTVLFGTPWRSNYDPLVGRFMNIDLWRAVKLLRRHWQQSDECDGSEWVSATIPKHETGRDAKV